MNRPLWNRLCLFFLLLILVSSCNSSRAIFTEKEIAKAQQLSPPSPEESFVRDNFASTNCTTWEQGKPFLYIADEINLMLTPQNNLETPPPASFRNALFRFHSIEERTNFGTPMASLLFECEGALYRFETGKSYKEISNSKYEPLIPDLISQEMLDKASQLLVDTTLYVLTPIWYDDKNEVVGGAKFLPVTVTRVEAGTNILPVKIWFRTDQNTEGAVLLSLTSDALSGQYLSFDRLFSFNDPHKRYPQISDKHWRLIQFSKVTAGMTKDACKLALGNPKEVERIPTYGGLKERWSYDTGVVYLFEDGLLTSAR